MSSLLMFSLPLLLWGTALAQAPNATGYDVALLGDLATGTGGPPASSFPTGFAPLGNRIYFTAADELWLTDGTASGTWRLAETCSETCPNGAIFDRSPDRLLITGFATDSAQAFWRLSAGGHVERIDTPQGLSFEAFQIATFDGGLLAPGYGEGAGAGLYLLDEQSLTIRRIEDLDVVPGGSPPARVVGAGRVAFFVADARSTVPPFEPRLRFFATDGSPGSTTLLVDQQASELLPVVDHSDTGFLVTQSDDGMGLWSSDGTPQGTVRIGRWSSSSDPYVPFPVAQTMGTAEGVALVAYDAEHGLEGWRAGGTAASPRRLTDLEAPQPTIRLLGSTEDRVFFEAADRFGTPYIWAVDTEGGAAPTQLSIGVAERAFLLGNRFVYVRADSGFSDSKAEIWTSDGTKGGTQLLAQGCLRFSCSDNVPEHVSSDGLLYFYVDYESPLGTELWRTDGTEAGTRVVARLPTAERNLLQAPSVAALAERVVFAANDPLHGTEPWSARLGFPDGASLLADLELRSPGLDLGPFVGLDSGEVLFVGCNASSTRVWQTRGTSSSTVPFGAQRQDFLRFCFDFQAPATVGDRAYFLDRPESILWTVDADATTIRKQFQTSSGTIRPELPVIGDRLLFMTEPYSSTSIVLRAVDSTATTERIAELPGELHGVAMDDTHVYLLLSKPDSLAIWSTDLTAEGTVLLKELPSYRDFSSNPVVVVGNALYFSGSVEGSIGGIFRVSLDDGSVEAAFGHRNFLVESGRVPFHGDVYALELDSSSNYSLMRLSAAGIGEIPLYSSPLAFAPPSQLVALSDGLYFFVPGEEGPRLWYSDGTLANTRELLTVPLSGTPHTMTSYDERLFFVAQDRAHGSELWTSDGTDEGTRLLRDIQPGSGSSLPGGLTTTPHGLFFGAEDGLHGREPWVVTSGQSCKATDNALCLNAERFRVEMTWRHPDGSLHIAGVRNLTADTGAFWFFNEDNLENIVKLLDGRSFNGAHWVFSGGLTSLEYHMTVTDTATGVTRRYFNPPSNLASYGDTGAFPENPSPESAGAEIDVTTLPGGLAQIPDARRSSLAGAEADASCVPSSTLLCLADGHFAVAVDWKTPGGASGVGTARELTNDTGAFSFFNQKNLEIVLKVLDGTAINGRHWVFYASLSNVDFTISVTDTQTGKIKTYRNSSGSFASVADTTAF